MSQTHQYFLFSQLHVKTLVLYTVLKFAEKAENKLFEQK